LSVSLESFSVEGIRHGLTRFSRNIQRFTGFDSELAGYNARMRTRTPVPPGEAVTAAAGVCLAGRIAITITATPRGVRGVTFGRRGRRGAEGRAGGPAGAEGRALERARANSRKAAEQISEYFRGTRRRFTCPLDLEGRGSAFERAVWEALRAIPHGRTRSYGEVASAIGRPGAARAVGAACGRNPLPILVPCHRVVGADGSLVGFSSGLGLKSLLLELEGVERRR
jgi:methylated-DNA-[protein]-cysteine S-methyltransferase